MRSAFDRINRPYKDQLEKFWFGELERVRDMPARGRRWIESYEACMQRFDKKLEREYRFATNPKKEMLMISQAAVALINQVE